MTELEIAKISDHLTEVVLATGGLGVAAYGIVDGLKLIPWIDLAGFERLFDHRTIKGGRPWPTQQRAGLNPLLSSLRAAYGIEVLELLKAQYRSGRSKGDLPRTLRQGVRIGFGIQSKEDISLIAQDLGIDKKTSDQAATALLITRAQRPPAAEEVSTEKHSPVNSEERSALARLETAIDARLDAALVLAEVQYVTQTKVTAMLIALTIALLIGHLIDANILLSLMIGLAAVPIAPVAKDIATALQEAVRALKKQ